jgi:hypothetical protein
MIVAADRCPSVPVRCITVDSPTGLFLAGRAYVPTHNSNTAAVFVEQLYALGQQVLILDPKGDWWDIRSSANGQGPGLPIVIIGGEHGDLPLEVQAREELARFVVEERVSVLLDLSHLRKFEIPLFLGGPTPPKPGEPDGFLEVLYRLKARESHRTRCWWSSTKPMSWRPRNPSRASCGCWAPPTTSCAAAASAGSAACWPPSGLPCSIPMSARRSRS